MAITSHVLQQKISLILSIFVVTSFFRHFVPHDVAVREGTGRHFSHPRKPVIVMVLDQYLPSTFLFKE